MVQRKIQEKIRNIKWLNKSERIIMKLTDKEAESVVKSINQSLENGKD